jgi:putative ABC transport system substrate-binding protein
MGTDLSGKRLSLLKEAVPNLSRVALLIDRSLDPNTIKHNISAYSKAAEEIGIVLHPIEAATPEAIDGAFSAAADDGCDGAIVVGSMLANEGPRVGASALAHRIPALSIFAEKVRFGLLMSYGQDVFEILVKTAGYVVKILKGAKPADLPVEQPTRLKLVINLKVAKALGVSIPPTLLASADEVIE